MEIKSDKKYIEPIISRFREIITSESSAGELCEVLDNVLFKYAMWVLQDRPNGLDGPEPNELYLLKMLRDMFITKELQP
jgi:hypothetical protein